MKILKGQVQWEDSFQELADLWQEKGYCETSPSPNKFSWALREEKPKVLLHEYDRVTVSDAGVVSAWDTPLTPTWDIEHDTALFANAQHPSGNRGYIGRATFAWLQNY